VVLSEAQGQLHLYLRDVLSNRIIGINALKILIQFLGLKILF
jgi:hypothetical protein